jgi:hypothetical protein
VDAAQGREAAAALQKLTLAKRLGMPVMSGSGPMLLEIQCLKKKAAAGRIEVSSSLFLIFCLFCFLGFRLRGSGWGRVPEVPEHRPHLQVGWAGPHLRLLQAAEDHMRSFGLWEEAEGGCGGRERCGVTEEAVAGGGAASGHCRMACRGGGTACSHHGGTSQGPRATCMGVWPTLGQC